MPSHKTTPKKSALCKTFERERERERRRREAEDRQGPGRGGRVEVQNAERRADGAAQEAMMAMESNRTHLQSSSKTMQSK
jgi:hypothetical protein